MLNALEDVILEHVEAKAVASMTGGKVLATSHKLAKLVALLEAMGTDRGDSTFVRYARKRCL